MITKKIQERIAGAMKRITVLVVDDHVAVRQGLCELLTSKNFIIAGEARNGREAVALERTLRPDVILMDIAMPLLNGIEATRQILSVNPRARVVILSAHNDEEYVQRTKAVGAAGFLSKQTSMTVLAQTIRIAAGRGSADRAAHTDGVPARQNS